MEFSRAFGYSVQLVLKVHQLMAAGQGDAAEANKLRADSEKPWYEMSEYEQDIVNGLSQDLYSLIDQPNGIQSYDVAFQRELAEALKSEDFLAALDTIRKHSHAIPADVCSHWRGVCWADMKFLAVAQAFFRHAIRLSPNNSFHRYFLLRALIQDKAFHDAIPLVAEIVAENNDPLQLYLASTVLLDQANRESGANRRDAFAKIIRVVERSNELAGKDLPQELKHDAVVANIWRSVAFDQLESPEQALEACEYALSLEPSNREARKLRAMLTRLINPSSSKEDALRGFGATQSHGYSTEMDLEPRFYSLPYPMAAAV